MRAGFSLLEFAIMQNDHNHRAPSLPYGIDDKHNPSLSEMRLDSDNSVNVAGGERPHVIITGSCQFCPL